MTRTQDFFDGHLGKWVAVVHLTLMNQMDEELMCFGLSRATFGFLVHLFIEDGQRQDQLCREIIVNKSTVTRAVHKLEKLGYVRRQSEKTDRRVVRVFLKPKGRAIREKIMEILSRYSEVLGRGLSPRQKSELIKTLQKVHSNICEYRDERHKKMDIPDEK